MAAQMVMSLQGNLQLTKHEKQLAKDIWAKTQRGMAFAKAGRKRILDEMAVSGALTCIHDGMRPDRFSETSAILQQTAALAENSALQQEIVLQSIRQFSLMVSHLLHFQLLLRCYQRMSQRHGFGRKILLNLELMSEP